MTAVAVAVVPLYDPPIIATFPVDQGWLAIHSTRS
jgi:hypothetical protein